MNPPLHRCAVVTGASAGIGAEFARQLAPRCKVLVLVARRAEPMEKLAVALRSEFPGLQVGVLASDLTLAADRESLIGSLQDVGLQPDLLVNNAGMGDYGEFASSDWPKVESMLRVNIEALTHLTHAMLPLMIRGGGGAIINVSSLASLLPIPDFAVYAATKAYVTSFSEALRIELKDHNIKVCALCPGPVKTEFGSVATREAGRTEIPGQHLFYIPAGQVVAEALEGLARDKARVYPGWQVAAAALVISALPIVAIRLMMANRPRR